MDLTKKKIMITGASGFIGGTMRRFLHEYDTVGVAINTTQQDRDNSILDVDLSEKEGCKKLFEKYTPDIIFHFAALTGPKTNEDNPELAVRMHTVLTSNVLNFMKEDAHILFPTTDKVFDGTEECPDENSTPKPTGIYARQKLETEKMIASRAKKYHIFRLPIVHDLGDPVSGSFVDKSIIALKNRQKVSAFKNVQRCYLKVTEFVRLLVQCTDDSHYGSYNLGADMASYIDRIKAMCDELRIDYAGLLEGGTGNVFPLVQDLNREKAKKTFGVRFT